MSSPTNLSPTNSSPVPNEQNESVATTVVNEYKSSAEHAYRVSGDAKTMLAVLSIGLKEDDGSNLMDVSISPWCDIKPRFEVKPTTKHLVAEVLRRAVNSGVSPLPRCSNWKMDKVMQWLHDHPLENDNDVAFVKSEVKRVKEIVTEAIKEAKDEEQKLNQYSAWRDRVPYLRLIHCVLEDDIKVVYLKRNDVMSRTQLDARNSDEKRPETAYELIADRWNSPAFNPVTEISTCHWDFASGISCSYDKVKDLAPATPQKVKDKLTEMRTSLIRIIDMWERSGQGDGGHAEEEEDDDGAIESRVYDFGELKNRSRKALDSRSSFLHNRPSYLLYLWEIFDKHDLLKTTVNRLSVDTGAVDGSVGSVPIVGNSSAKKRKKGSIECISTASTGSKENNASDSLSLRMSDNLSSDLHYIGSQMDKDRLNRTILAVDERITLLEDRIERLETEHRKYRILAAKAEKEKDEFMLEIYIDERNKLAQQVTENADKLKDLHEERQLLSDEVIDTA